MFRSGCFFSTWPTHLDKDQKEEEEESEKFDSENLIFRGFSPVNRIIDKSYCYDREMHDNLTGRL